VSSARHARAERRADNQIEYADETELVLVAAMTRDIRSRSWIMDWMCRRCAIPCGDRLRASHVHRRFACYFGSKTKTAAAVMAFFVRHRAHGVTLGVIAGPAAWPPGYAGSWNYDDAHVFILAVSSAAIRNTPTPLPFSH
jgi:hypothetical protein